MPAGDAEIIVVIDQPVADVERGIGAKAYLAVRIGNQLPVRIVTRFQRVHRKIACKETEAVVAAHALPVVKMDDLIAIVAGKQLHGRPPMQDMTENARRKWVRQALYA
jgi:hypothetical protein